jgi:diaminohydroxyphosphoribosylaminopyrimidine deaminase / 5-amino-6-(5-phosphoribosylamino)uracil reductase
MTTSPAEIEAMRRAIAVSAFGIGTTSPNPPVGCVILDAAGQPVGTGYHLRKGEPHAEVNALTAAGENARGGTAVVTLEPCNHIGVSPACRQALLDAGIARVVIAVMDPTSRGEGGAAVLRAAGVDVEVGVLEQEAMVVLGDWLHALHLQRPITTWAFKIDIAGAMSEPSGIARWRAQYDLVTGGVELTEGVPGGHGRFEVPSRNVLDDDPATALKTMYDSGARTLLVAGNSALAAKLRAADLFDRLRIEVVRLPPSAGAAPLPVPDGFAFVDVTATLDSAICAFARTAEARDGR